MFKRVWRQEKRLKDKRAKSHSKCDTTKTGDDCRLNPIGGDRREVRDLKDPMDERCHNCSLPRLCDRLLTVQLYSLRGVPVRVHVSASR
eukprot:2604110-Prymnesium_polylepis.1